MWNSSVYAYSTLYILILKLHQYDITLVHLYQWLIITEKTLLHADKWGQWRKGPSCSRGQESVKGKKKRNQTSNQQATHQLQICTHTKHNILILLTITMFIHQHIIQWTHCLTLVYHCLLLWEAVVTSVISFPSWSRPFSEGEVRLLYTTAPWGTPSSSLWSTH